VKLRLYAACSAPPHPDKNEEGTPSSRTSTRLSVVLAFAVPNRRWKHLLKRKSVSKFEREGYFCVDRTDSHAAARCSIVP